MCRISTYIFHIAILCSRYSSETIMEMVRSTHMKATAMGMVPSK